jgi:hypothetical protein
VLKYIEFLRSPLEIWMFVACKFVKGKWVILEEPNRSTHTDKECKEYKKAKERCLFEGFEYVTELQAVRNNDKQSIIFHSLMSCQTIEYYSNRGILLTQTAIEQIGV